VTDAGRRKAAKPRPKRKCPICGEPATEAFYPFCSRKCANIDLNRWLSGAYFIPATEESPSSDGDGQN